MTYRTIQVPNNSPVPILIGRATPEGDGYTLANFDLVNSVWISTEKNFQPGAADSIAIPPLGSAPLPSNLDTYAITNVVTGVSVGLIPGSGGWTPSPAQVSAQISALGLARDATVQGVAKDATVQGVAKDATVTGVAKDGTLTGGAQLTGLVAAPVSLYTITAQTLTQNNSSQLVPNNPSPIASFAQCNQMGYELNLQMRGVGAATVDFVEVDVTFFDDDSLTAVPIDIMTWWIPVSASGNGKIIIVGKGPLRGAYMAVSITNPSPGFPLTQGSVTFDLELKGVGRAYQRDDWREAAPLQGLAGANATRPGSVLAPGSNALFSIASQTAPSNVAAGANTQRMLPLYSGRLQVRMGLAAAVAGNTFGFHFYPQNCLNNAGGSAATPIYEIFLGASGNTLSTVEMYFPHDCINLFISNNSASAVGFWVTAMTEDY